MLIGFTGVGGTGKTVTAKALAEKLNLPFVASSSRAVFAKRGIVEADQAKFTPEEQYQLQQEIFQSREHLEAQTTEGVADRTLYDQVAYNLLRANSVITVERMVWMMERAKHWTKRYDHIFYFPFVTFATAEDGMRDNTHGTRRVFDHILTGLLRGANVAVEEVPVMDVDTRAEWIKRRVLRWNGQL